MKLRHVKNPAEASKAVRALQKAFRTKVCMAPDKSQCSRDIVAAHTLSAQAMLRPISRDGHVYTFAVNHYAANIGKIAEMRLTGIANTSVFNGFCSFHDKILFSEIEDQTFVCTSKQVFLHAFRAVAKECYLKNRQAQTSPTQEIFEKVHGITDGSVMPPEFILMQLGSLVGADEITRLKARLDQIYLASDWSRLLTTVIHFKRKPTFVCSSVFSPDFDFAGNRLQDFSDLERDLQNLIVTVLPASDGGFALFSCLDSECSAGRKLVRSLLNQRCITSALIWLLVGQFENIAISPDWLDSQSAELKDELVHHFIKTADPMNGVVDRLRLHPEFIDDWQPISIFEI